MGIKQHSLAAMFLMDQICFDYFIQGNQVTISAKLFSILLIKLDLEETLFKIFSNRYTFYGNCPTSLVDIFLTDQISFNYFFCKRSPNVHLSQILLNSDQQYQRRRFLKFPFP